VDHAFEARVLDARGECRTNHPPIRAKAQLQPGRIGLAADEAGMGVGQFAHGGFRQRQAAGCKGKSTREKAPSTNIQAPEKLHIPSIKARTPTVSRATQPWSLVFAISLELGCWCLEFYPVKSLCALRRFA
jgi:hypothetical protein